jgi:hypothetical protein
MVKLKSPDELKALGIKSASPYADDIGIVIQINESHKNNYLLVLWQKANEEVKHFPTVLDKIGDSA